MTDNTSQTTKESVLAKIRERRIGMRSKLSFTFETALAGFVALVILAVSVAIVSFILFGLRVNGHESLLAFGPRGIGSFLLIFPWPLLLLDVLLIVFLESLLRRFKFGYRSPILYLLLGLLAVAIAAGLALDRGTSFNDDLLQHADHGDLPAPFGELYEHVRAPAPHEHGIYRGTITAIGTSTMTMAHDDLDRDTDESSYTVVFPDGYATSSLSVGERVYVAGDEEDHVIRAFGVNPLPPAETTPAPQP